MYVRKVLPEKIDMNNRDEQILGTIRYNMSFEKEQTEFRIQGSEGLGLVFRSVADQFIISML